MNYFFLSATLMLFACNANHETAQQETIEKPTLDSVESRPSEVIAKTNIIDGGNDCIHQVTQPTLKNSTYPKAGYQLKNESSSIETIDLDNGDKLILKNWGCDYAALTFRFETVRFQEEPSNAGFWYKRIVTLLNEVNKNLDKPPVDVEKGTERLVTQIENDLPNGYENLKFGEELDYGEEAIRSFVRIDNVEKLDDKKVALEITFAKGPLK